MERNIFIAKYKNENAWTEVFMKFLANSNTKIMNSFFEYLNTGIKIRSIDKVSFEMQEDEELSTPDATISSLDDYFIIHFEMKKGEGFRVSQAENHFQALLERMNKVKVLVIMTNDANEPVEFTKFSRKYNTSSVKIKFVSWNDIATFVGSVHKKETDNRIKFLAEQYGDFIEKEVKPKLKWTGFEKDFHVKWEEFYKFRNEIRKLLDNEIVSHVEHHIEHKWPDYKKSPRSEKINRETAEWTLWEKRNSWLAIGVGFVGEDEYLSDPILYVEWGWSPSIHERIKNNTRFIELKKKMEAKNFRFDDNWIEQVLRISDLYNLSTNNQLKKIFSVIDNTVTIFEDSGLVKLIKK